MLATDNDGTIAFYRNRTTIYIDILLGAALILCALYMASMIAHWIIKIITTEQSYKTISSIILTVAFLAICASFSCLLSFVAIYNARDAIRSYLLRKAPIIVLDKRGVTLNRWKSCFLPWEKILNAEIETAGGRNYTPFLRLTTNDENVKERGSQGVVMNLGSAIAKPRDIASAINQARSNIVDK